MSIAQSINCRGLLLALTLAAWIVGTPSHGDAQDRPDANPDDAQDETAAPAPHQAAASVLDIIPDDVALAIAVPDLQRLKQRGDRLFDETNGQGLRVSEIFSEMYKFLKVEGIVDEQRPAAAMLVNFRDVGLDDVGVDTFMQAIVVRLPVKNVAEAAKRFDLDDDAIANNRIVAFNAPNGFVPSRVCYKDGYLLLSTTTKAIESALDGEPISAQLPGERGKAAALADVVVLAGTHSWANEWKSYVERVESEEFSLGHVPNEEELKDLFRKTVPDTRLAILTATIDDGIHVRLAAHISTGGAAEAALAEIRGDNATPANLAPLPQGHILGALAASGDELRTIATARLLAPLALEAISRTDLLKGNDPTRMLGTFDGVRRQLTGVRMALYATGAATQTELSSRGMMAGVFLLDTAEPKQLIESIVAEGIVLGGQSRDSGDEEDGEPVPRIKLRHLPEQETLAGYAVDHLEIDTTSIDRDTSAALREAFGPAWMFVRAAPLENQVVVLLGTERRVLEATLEGMDAQGTGLAESKPFTESRARLDAAHQAALYVSLQRTLPVAAGVGSDSMQREVDRVTSAAVTIERDLLQIEFWLPLAEIQALPKDLLRFW